MANFTFLTSDIPAVVAMPTDPLGRLGQAGHDKTDMRVQLAPMPIDLCHNPARLDPALGVVAEADLEYLRPLRRATDRLASRRPIRACRSGLAGRRII